MELRSTAFRGPLRLVRQLIDWRPAPSGYEGADWLRVDVWPTNERLQHYYLRQGFTYVRTVVLPTTSGALFQRPAQHLPTPRLQDVESLTVRACDGPASGPRGGSLVLPPRPGWRDLPDGAGMPRLWRVNACAATARWSQLSGGGADAAEPLG
jgi:hypothetical protein